MQTATDVVFAGLDRSEYERLTRELTGYCYRMLGSPFDAEDAVQDTMMRAWRDHDHFEGRSSLRTWFYRIATNVCIDMLRSRGHRVVPMDLQPPSPVDGVHSMSTLPEREWVLPVPCSWVAADNDPAQRVISRETVRLAFVAALQRLTPRQRAVLILRDVLQFSAAESAELLGTTVASANSALQRARVALPGPAADEGAAREQHRDQELLDEYVTAFEAYDMRRLTSLLRSDVIQSMPPFKIWLTGREEITAWMLGPGAKCRGSRLLPTSANGCAAFAQYRSDGQGGHKPWAIQVVETDSGLISALHVFVMMPELFTVFGMPTRLG
jgi:RNA polymerase sigma-70 factor (ECF subfamily)